MPMETTEQDLVSPRLACCAEAAQQQQGPGHTGQAQRQDGLKPAEATSPQAGQPPACPAQGRKSAGKPLQVPSFFCAKASFVLTFWKACTESTHLQRLIDLRRIKVGHL